MDRDVNQTERNGFTLIEVMVTAAIVAIGLIGLAASLVKSIQFNHQAQLLSDTTIATASMLDLMRLHPAAVTAGDFNLEIASGAVFTPSNHAEEIVNLVLTSLSTSHPGTTLEIDCETSVVSYCQLCIGWDNRQSESITTSELTTTNTVICSDRLVL